MNKDRIIMRGMEFYGFHGVLDLEREKGQPFIVDLDLVLDLKPAGITDDLSRTVSYAEVYRTVATIMTGPACRLLEALAENIARAVLANYPVTQVMVRIKKPQAPVAGKFRYMAVEICRDQYES